MLFSLEWIFLLLFRNNHKNNNKRCNVISTSMRDCREHLHGWKNLTKILLISTFCIAKASISKSSFYFMIKYSLSLPQFCSQFSTGSLRREQKGKFIEVMIIIINYSTHWCVVTGTKKMFIQKEKHMQKFHAFLNHTKSFSLFFIIFKEKS